MGLTFKKDDSLEKLFEKFASDPVNGVKITLPDEEDKNKKTTNEKKEDKKKQ